MFKCSDLRSPKRQLACKKKVQSTSSLCPTISKRPPMPTPGNRKPTPSNATHLINSNSGSLPTAYVQDKMYASIREHQRPRSAIVDVSTSHGTI